MKSKNEILARAAIAGILGASIMASSGIAFAADEKEVEKGHCVGANSCKGQGACAQKGKNECAGKNGCGGKGFLEKTKAECDALAKTNKKIQFKVSKK